jgi:hypothetical protein
MWQVTYAFGAKRQFSLRSKGIPLGITPSRARAMMVAGFHRQPVSQEKLEELACAQGHVCQFVDAFGTAENVVEWEAFFNKVTPKSPISAGSSSIEESDNWLNKLYTEYGGDARRKDRSHLRERDTLTKYSEPCSWPDSPWTASERDKAAEYAVATDTTKALLVERSDLKRKRRPKPPGALPLDIPSVKNQRKVKPKVKYAGIINKVLSDCESTGLLQSKKKKSKRGRPKKAVDIDDEESACSASTGVSSFAPSMKSGDDSDIGYNDGLWDLSTCDESSVTTDISDYSYIDLPSVPANMKGKGEAQMFWKMIGKRFLNTEEDDEMYRIISVCEYDFGDSTRMLDKLCFRYALDNLDSPTTDDLEIALCSEMMDTEWVQWLKDEDNINT